jgi:formate transporter
VDVKPTGVSVPTETGQFDALLPAEMAARAEQVGLKKAQMATTAVFVLAVLAGAFIGLGALFSTTVLAGAGDGLPYGVARLLAGVAFSLGLILVVIGGAELFTGNTLIVMAWASGRVRTRLVLRNWAVVYAGNFRRRCGHSWAGLCQLAVHLRSGSRGSGCTGDR